VTRTGRTYQPKKISDYKKQVQEAVQGQLPDGFSCIKADTPIHITRLHYVFEYPKAFSKKKRAEDRIHFKHTKPDLHDNLNKALFDALEGVVWERDQNVVAMDDVKKYYQDNHQIIIHLKCLNS
jgi:Holliday junction resolvase RusA-like endonuclease